MIQNLNADMFSGYMHDGKPLNGGTHNSDYNMQDGTGLDLLEEIRQKGITVPFLLMSGDDDCLIEQQTKFYGGVFCCKTDYDLIAKIKALITLAP